jgi:hypothetical protein
MPATKGPRAVDAGRFDDGQRDALQAGAHHHIDERRMVQAEHQNDAAASEHRIGAACFRREAERVQDGRGRACQMQKGEGDHLGRNHHRQDEEERRDAAPADIGDAEDKRHGSAERQRQKRR